VPDSDSLVTQPNNFNLLIVTNLNLNLNLTGNNGNTNLDADSCWNYFTVVN
jgi:hypothetical protein